MYVYKEYNCIAIFDAKINNEVAKLLLPNQQGGWYERYNRLAQELVQK